ncbi:MAG: hypothetical protein KA187_07305 [Arenimonas sp.]|nr:hypothetical protein [Arenimonas sp.]
MNHVTIVAAALLLVAPLAPAAAQESTGWEWELTPYFWAPSISSDLREDVPPVGNDAAFEDFIDKIDGAFLGHAEGQGENFGVFADLLFLSLSDDKQYTRTSTASDLDSTVYEMAMVWSPGEVRYRGVEVFAGLRYLDVDLTIDVDPVDPIYAPRTLEAERSYSDFMLGLRYRADFSDKWGYSLRADGAWGDTEGSYNAMATLYRQTGNGEWSFGYRYFDTELRAARSSLTLTLNGPVVGYTFRF